MYRKGISPLVAGVLLVAFTVAIATIAGSWMGTFTFEITTKISNQTKTGIECALANVEIDAVYVTPNTITSSGTVRAAIRNTGMINISIVSATLFDKLGNSFSASGLPTSMDKGEIKTPAFTLEQLPNMTNDSTINNNDGHLNNNPTWNLSGYYGSAITFDGINDYIDVGNDPSLNITGNFTLEAWVYFRNVNNLYPVVLGKGAGDTYVMKFTNTTRKIEFWGTIGGTGYHDTGTCSAILVEEWTHVAVRYNGSYINCFVNGVIGDISAASGAVGTNTKTLLIGNTHDRAYYWNGSIDEVAVWSRALTNEEINSTMNFGVTSIGTTGLMGYWAFGDAKGVVACPKDFSKLIVKTDCGGIEDIFDTTPTCA